MAAAPVHFAAFTALPPQVHHSRKLWSSASLLQREATRLARIGPQAMSAIWSL